MIVFAQRFFQGRPPWIDGLMGARDAAAGLFGLKTADTLTSPPTFEAGSTFAIFKVFAREERELLLGQDDQHLDFRLSLLIDDERKAVVSTVVKFHGRVGRAYFLPVRPVHRRIVQAMLSRAVGKP